MKKMRAGVIGVGFIGAAHIEALRRLGYVDVVALAAARDAEKKAASLYVPNGYADYREMIDRENLDAVHICTPNSMHYEMAMYAMEKGVHVLCEKPLSVTAAEARSLRDYALSHSIVNCVNFNLRQNPQVVQMKEMVKAGDVGKIYSIHGSYLQDWLYCDTDYSWRLDPSLSGESCAFTDIGSHWIDMVENITGQKMIEVLADFSTVHKTRKKPLKPIDTYSGMALKPEDYQEIPISTEDCCTVLFHFDGGAKGVCTISQVYAGRKNQTIISVSGSKSSLHWDSEQGNELWMGRRETYNSQIVKDPSILYEETQKVINYPGGHTEGFPDTHKQNFAKFYQAVEAKDTSARDFATFEAGCREMVLCEKICESARTRRWVRVGE